jgi:predicted anti-sigma-YlaC factor YlaD
VKRRPRHLKDDRLFESYFANRSGNPVEPSAGEHLTDCQACGTRYTEIAEFLDILHEEAETAADAVFTPERLLAQQHQVARRLEHVGRAARVLNFPHPTARAALVASSSHAATRWIAAAAAAGLFVGVALGAAYKTPWTLRPIRSANTIMRRATPAPSVLAPLGTIGDATEPDVASDDAFLSELELALDRPRSHELLAYDALTPHVREIRDIR